MTIVRADLRRVLERLLPRAVWGRVKFADGTDGPDFSTLQVPRAEQVFKDRGGRRCGYHACPGCRRIQAFGEVAEGIIEGHLLGRQLVVDCHGSIYVSAAMADELDLRRQFEDLRLFRIPLLDRPLDGWVLPGDDGWSGALAAPPSWIVDRPFPVLTSRDYLRFVGAIGG